MYRAQDRSHHARPAHVCYPAGTRSLGREQPTLPLLVEKPGRTQDEAPRRWHGHSVLRQVEVEYSEGRVAQAELRFVVVHSSQLAQQQTQTYAAAPGKEAAAVVDHVRQVHARWFACL